MRILMIGGNHAVMLDDCLTNAASVIRVNRLKAEVLLPGEVSITCHVIRGPIDADMLRGQRFDLIVQHLSYRGGEAALQQLRATVLRA